MNIIARRTLNRWTQQHPDAMAIVESWYRVAIKARWENLHDVRQTYASVDQVGSCLVFNIKGNRYRLICGVMYATNAKNGTLFLKHFLTHAEYDKTMWKKDCQYGDTGN